MIISVSMSFTQPKAYYLQEELSKLELLNQRLCVLEKFKDIAKISSKGVTVIYVMYEVLFPYTLKHCALSTLLNFANLTDYKKISHQF